MMYYYSSYLLVAVVFGILCGIMCSSINVTLMVENTICLLI